ncbi:MAG: hypothetical protein U9N87_08505 [Planctomycetota bacterium]|nr:hypothetical protein [Planctomycetota bacterium]
MGAGRNSIFTIALTAVLVCAAVVYPARADDGGHNRGPIVNLAADGVAHLYLRPEFEIDGSHSKEELVGAFQQVVDRYARARVPYLFLNVCYQRTTYDSAVWDSYWDVKDPDRQVSGWPRRMWMAYRAGVDPFAVCVARCREKGISPWMSIRMNDTHYIDDPTRTSTFWQKHPELRINSGNGGYDFARPAVQKYYLALIEELLLRYDCDGIELDWMRFPSHFRPGQEERGRQHLNDFMRRAKKLAQTAAKTRGHAVKIAARIPAVPRAGLARGMDGAAWVRQRLADILVLSAVWRPTDTDIPIEQWRKSIGPVEHEYLLAAATDLWIQSSPGGRLMKDDLETQRGFTAAMLDRGADLIYLFNHFNTNDFRLKLRSADGRDTIRDENHELLETAGRMKAALCGPRRHVLSFHDPAPPGDRRPLPAEISSGRTATFQIHTGPKPERGRVVIRIGLAKNPGLKHARPAARLNGSECRPISDLSTPASIPFKPLAGGGVPHVAYVAERIVRFEAPLESMRRGSNRIEATLQQGQPQKIVWVEIYIDP